MLVYVCLWYVRYLIFKIIRLRTQYGIFLNNLIYTNSTLLKNKYSNSTFNM
jgi:hypothetical protein